MSYSPADDSAHLDGRHHRRLVRLDARLRQPARARARPAGRHLDRAVPGRGHRHVRARHRGRHHPQPRRRPRHRRARGAAAGQHDRRRPAGRRRARESRGAGRSDRGAALPTGRGRAPVGHADPDDHDDGGRRDDHDRRRRDHDHAAGRRRGHDHDDRRDRGAGAAHVPTAPIAATRPAQETTVAPDTTPTTVAGATAPTTTAAEATPSTVAQPQPGQSVQRPAHATRRERRPMPTVWLPGRPVDGGDPASCFLLGPTVLTGRNISSGRGELRPEHLGYVTDIKFKNDDFVDKVAEPVRQPARRDRARRRRAVGAHDQPGHHRPERADLG